MAGNSECDPSVWCSVFQVLKYRGDFGTQAKTSLENGRTALPTHALSQVHDIIKLTSPLRQGISEKVAELAASGRSQREIALELNVSKTWVQCALVRLKRRQHRQLGGTDGPIKSAFARRSSVAPFGFDYLEGHIVENPRELRTVQRIIDLWNSGLGHKAITRELNRLKLQTRKGKKWDHSVVSDIILRVHSGSVPYDQFAPGLRPYVVRKSPVPRKKDGKKNEN